MLSQLTLRGKAFLFFSGATLLAAAACSSPGTTLAPDATQASVAQQATPSADVAASSQRRHVVTYEGKRLKANAVPGGSGSVDLSFNPECYSPTCTIVGQIGWLAYTTTDITNVGFELSGQTENIETYQVATNAVPGTYQEYAEVLWTEDNGGTTVPEQQLIPWTLTVTAPTPSPTPAACATMAAGLSNFTSEYNSVEIHLGNIKTDAGSLDYAAAVNQLEATVNQSTDFQSDSNNFDKALHSIAPSYPYPATDRPTIVADVNTLNSDYTFLQGEPNSGMKWVSTESDINTMLGVIDDGDGRDKEYAAVCTP